MEKPTEPPEGGRHYNPRMTDEEAKAEAGAIVAARARHEQTVAEQMAEVVPALKTYLDEHKAASTRDRLAHQALAEGKK
ncbi:MAG: hypothetical protein KJ947_22550 [Alphaproteobacteria bacterium]|jgi:hypothetical protein|nr:hypothetical protein [Alphaproteobacteria bacterium]MBU1552327.1 hypothetical protein [Alphaproteobacteria bacterium]MBU2334520.1 hypothetical protein [Alphaproteobacteria bacterium]MBU2386375.1 hypothetical protein [Alphaproteobacteria bacterium]